MFNPNEPTVIFKGNAIEAMIIKEKLESEGIEVFVNNELGGGLNPNSIAQILVPLYAKNAANKIISENTNNTSINYDYNDTINEKNSTNSGVEKVDIPLQNKIINFSIVILSMAVGRYAGLNFVFPAIFMIILYILFKKIIFNKNDKLFIDSSVLLLTQFAWMLIGQIIIMNSNIYLTQTIIIMNFIELTIYLFFGIIILYKPNLIFGLLIIITELGVLLINSYYIIQVNYGTEQHKGLVVHILIRIAVILYTSFSLKNLYETKKQIIANQNT